MLSGHVKLLKLHYYRAALLLSINLFSSVHWDYISKNLVILVLTKLSGHLEHLHILGSLKRTVSKKLTAYCHKAETCVLTYAGQVSANSHIKIFKNGYT